ncbi:hypothetical protein AMECASPLE_026921, partial [Ameca splendens]
YQVSSSTGHCTCVPAPCCTPVCLRTEPQTPGKHAGQLVKIKACLGLSSVTGSVHCLSWHFVDPVMPCSVQLLGSSVHNVPTVLLSLKSWDKNKLCASQSSSSQTVLPTRMALLDAK